MNEDAPLNDSTDVSPAEQVQETETTEATKDVSQSAGALLTAHRESRGWSIEQVANQLNLAARQIDALERDNYAALPGMVIVRGFIRSYAKLLQVDAAPILALVKGDVATTNILPPPRTAMSASFSETQLLSERGRGRFPWKTVAGVAIVVAVAGLVIFEGQRVGWKLGSSTHASADKTTEELPHVTPEEPVPPEQNPVAQEAVAQPVADITAPTQSAASATTGVAAPVTSTASPSVITATGAAAEQKNPVAAADGKNVLAIHATQDSWVEIKRADNTVIVSSLLKAGTDESIDITGPVSMVVGNAAGVTIKLRGEPVDVTGNSSNVARLNLK